MLVRWHLTRAAATVVVRQLVILGAGLDTRAYRLPRDVHVRCHRGGGVGKHTLVEQVQRKLEGAVGGDAAESPTAVADAAAHGVSGAGGPLPHADAIQRAFGRHDVSGITAHTDAAAAAGARAMGAQAFATGNHVAFAGVPDLHTAAHEVAHIVQQRAGISLKGGVGAEGDVYEQHADAVADRVVAGGSAEALLDRFAPGGVGGAAGVQRKLGANQASGIRVREISMGRTGVITGKMVWGKYPVQWDDGKSSQVDANDDKYEVVGGRGDDEHAPGQHGDDKHGGSEHSLDGRSDDRAIHLDTVDRQAAGPRHLTLR